MARLSLQVPDSGSLKAKRQVLRRVTDRVKARFNVSVAEVADQDLWQRVTLALAVVGSDRRHVDEQLEKVIHFIEELYVAPLVSRETEVVGFGDQLYASPRPGEGAEGGGPGAPDQTGRAIEEWLVDRGDRSLAEAEGLESWDAAPARAVRGESPSSLEEARARARSLRKPREWEKK